MSDTEHREPATNTSTREVSPAASVDLDREIETLRASETFKRGRAAARLSAFRNLRITLFVLRTGASLGEHHHAGRVSIQAIRGRIRVQAGGKTFELTPERLVLLDRNVPHDVEAIEDSAFLVSVAFEDRDAPA